MFTNRSLHLDVHGMPSILVGMFIVSTHVLIIQKGNKSIRISTSNRQCTLFLRHHNSCLIVQKFSQVPSHIQLFICLWTHHNRHSSSLQVLNRLIPICEIKLLFTMIHTMFIDRFDVLCIKKNVIIFIHNYHRPLIHLVDNITINHSISRGFVILHKCHFMAIIAIFESITTVTVQLHLFIHFGFIIQKYTCDVC